MLLLFTVRPLLIESIQTPQALEPQKEESGGEKRSLVWSDKCSSLAGIVTRPKNCQQGNHRSATEVVLPSPLAWPKHFLCTRIIKEKQLHVQEFCWFSKAKKIQINVCNFNRSSIDHMIRIHPQRGLSQSSADVLLRSSPTIHCSTYIHHHRSLLVSTVIRRRILQSLGPHCRSPFECV